MNNRFKIIKENYICLVTTAIIILALTVLFIARGILPFGNNSIMVGDGVDEFVPMMSLLRRKLIENQKLYFSFDVGMGVGTLGMFATYASSPLNLFLVLVSEKNLLLAVHVMWMIKIALCGFTMSYYLLHRNEAWKEGTHKESDGEKTALGNTALKNNYIICTVSILYALNNYIFAFANNIMWVDCIIWLPIIMLGLERLVKDGRCCLYIISLGICIISNYYISFEICIFLFIVFILCDFESVRDFISRGLCFATSSILAAGLSAFLILPTYLQIRNTASSGAGLPKPSLMGNIFNVLGATLFGTEPVCYSNFDYSANIYCGVFAIMAAFAYVIVNKHRTRYAVKRILLLLFMIISCDEELLNFIWHGFHAQVMVPNRFAFMIIFLLLVMSYDVLNKLEMIGIKSNIYMVIAPALLILLCVVFSEEGINTISFAISLILMMVYGLLIYIHNKTYGNDTEKPSRRKVLVIILMTVMLVELTTHMIYIYRNFEMADVTENYIEATEKQQLVQHAKDRLLENDFLRIELAEADLNNEGMLRTMPSISLFSSTISGGLYKTLGELGCDTNTVRYTYQPTNEYFDSLLSINYIITDETSELDVEYIKNQYEKLCGGERYTLYQNPYCLPVGYAVSDDVMQYKCLSMDNYSDEEKHNSLIALMLGADDEEIKNISVEGFYSELKDNTLTITEKGDNYLEGTIEIKDGQVLFLSIPYDKGWTAYVDREEADIYSIDGAFIALKPGTGKHTISMEYYPVGLKPGIIISIISCLMLIGILVINRRQRT